MALSKFFLPHMKKMLKPYRAINKKIHEATGKVFAGGNVRKEKEGKVESPKFRQVGKSPEDKSGFKVQHLGDKK